MHHLPRPALPVIAVATLALCAQFTAGCRGCGKTDAPPAPIAPPTPAAEPAAPAAQDATAVTAPEAPSPVASPWRAPDVYPGPRSEALDGWRVTSGFSNLKDEQLPEPKALDDTRIYLTALDPEGHPIGNLEKLERAELHVFLVAKDMRHAVYGSGSGAVREGADARSVVVRAPEGGDHAMVAVFKPAGGVPHVVSAPVTIKGVLPEVMGPGVAKLTATARSEAETVVLSSAPQTPVAGQPVHLTAQDLDAKGGTRGEVRLPFVVVLNDQMGWGDVVEWDATGKATWTPRCPGDFLVLAPPTRGSKALAFKLHVEAPPSP
ncbi:MAG: hypothetical protein FJ100_15960 [Deltaproteobacteria bacterium]|nr:hypothetical protein [Deltaproteobacteria bacterium]